jgi:hypothetical protein
MAFGSAVSGPSRMAAAIPRPGHGFGSAGKKFRHEKKPEN